MKTHHLPSSTATPLRTLRDLPGPRGLPLIGNTLQIDTQKFHSILEDWAKQFGSIYTFKLGMQSAVVIADGELNNQLLRARPDTYRRISDFEMIFKEMGLHGVFSAEGEEWRQQRQLAMQSLSNKYLRNFFPTMKRIIERLQRRWVTAAEQQSTVDVKEDLSRLTVDMTTNLTFGYDMNTLEHDSDMLQDQLVVILPMIAQRLTAPLPYWRYFKLPADRTLDRSLAVIDQFIHTFIAQARQRMQENPSLWQQPTNFLEAMLGFSQAHKSRENETRGNENGGKQEDETVDFSDREIAGNVFTMLMAGEDTSSITLSWILHYMTLYPDMQAKMQAEADAVLGSNRTLTDLQDADKLVYIEAVANEALRLRPPSPTYSLEPLHEVEIDGVQIPAHTPLFLLARPAIWDEQNFAHAQEFRPERWLADNDCPFHGAHNRSVYIPFGNGPRICPGRNIALLEIKAVMAMICRNFTVTSVNSPDQVDECYAFTMMPIGLAMRFAART